MSRQCHCGQLGPHDLAQARGEWETMPSLAPPRQGIPGVPGSLHM